MSPWSDVFLPHLKMQIVFCSLRTLADGPRKLKLSIQALFAPASIAKSCLLSRIQELPAVTVHLPAASAYHHYHTEGKRSSFSSFTQMCDKQRDVILLKHPVLTWTEQRTCKKGVCGLMRVTGLKNVTPPTCNFSQMYDLSNIFFFFPITAIALTSARLISFPCRWPNRPPSHASHFKSEKL